MHQQPDQLARLRADRDLTLRAVGEDHSAIARQRCAVARRYGRDLAAGTLSWWQITLFRDSLTETQAGRYAPWGPHVIECLAGRDAALAAPPMCAAAWLAFLAGIEDTAQAVEAAG